LALALVAVSTRPAFAHERDRFVPFAGIEAGQTWERLAVTFDGREQHEDRWLWNTRFLLGLSARLPDLAGWATRTDSSVAFGVVHHTGHGHLDLRQAALLELPLGADFSVPMGISVGFVADTASSKRSAFEAGVPVGVRFRFVELLYRPGFSLPLGAEERRVFSGTRQHSARPGIVPLDLSLRFHVTGLGF
jgi:hypothetical protein